MPTPLASALAALAAIEARAAAVLAFRAAPTTGTLVTVRGCTGEFRVCGWTGQCCWCYKHRNGRDYGKKYFFANARLTPVRA